MFNITMVTRRFLLKLYGVVLLLCFVSCEDLKVGSVTTDENKLPTGKLISSDHWLYSFAWNLVGYSIIIIPAFLVIRMIKKSNFYEKEGEGLMFRTIQCCVFGSPKDVSVSSNSFSRLFRCLQGTNQTAVTFRLMFCVAGLQSSYLTWGVLQEKIMTRKYGESDHAVSFTNSEFLVFSNRFFALLVAAFYMYVTGPNWSGPFYRFSFSSLSNICSSWCQYEALKFVSFPTQVLAKASKMIPVMIMGRFVSHKTYQYYEYVVALMISIGVSLFLLATGSDKHRSTETTVSGFILMIGYMGFDSFTSNWQSKLFSEYKVSSMQMMFNVNIFSALFTIVPLVLSGGLFKSIAFMTTYPAFMQDTLIISIASATGQLFIFYTISEFGPLVFTTIMVTRQMLAILLSCIIYSHYLTSQAVMGVGVVFMALFLQIYAKYRIKQKQLRAQREQNIRVSDMA